MHTTMGGLDGIGSSIQFLLWGAAVFAVVAYNSGIALVTESYNALSRKLSLYSLVVGIAGASFFIWLLVRWLIFLNSQTHAKPFL